MAIKCKHLALEFSPIGWVYDVPGICVLYLKLWPHWPPI